LSVESFLGDLVCCRCFRTWKGVYRRCSRPSISGTPDHIRRQSTRQWRACHGEVQPENADDGTFYVCCNAFQVSDFVVYATVLKRLEETTVRYILSCMSDDTTRLLTQTSVDSLVREVWYVHCVSVVLHSVFACSRVYLAMDIILRLQKMQLKQSNTSKSIKS